ncbi:hypothetical protein JTE90_008161 [Oedothorax gibbosus]|uniref:Uncharacterized protein n=1 Tax=Oedothorax gibbosus TaxID=931172 RepID=A0AAV6VG35_9ARAC|nr:hypothetical protein JTE90_008161 [Oedothorax gibbosus]
MGTQELHVRKARPLDPVYPDGGIARQSVRERRIRQKNKDPGNREIYYSGREKEKMQGQVEYSHGSFLNIS